MAPWSKSPAPARIKSPVSKSALAAGWLVAGIAAGLSAGGAIQIGADPRFAGWVMWILLGLSVILVWIEKNALTWVAIRKERNDHGAKRLALVALVFAMTYTAALQVSLLGSVFLTQVADDNKRAIEISTLEARHAELKRKEWRNLPDAMAHSLKREVAALEEDAKRKGKQFAESATAAAKALPAKRAALSLAEIYEAEQAEIKNIGAKLAGLHGTPPADTKSAVIGGIVRAITKDNSHGPESHLSTYLLIIGVVALIQFLQVSMGKIAGKSELLALKAAQFKLEPASDPGGAVVAAAVAAGQAQAPALPPPRPAQPTPAVPPSTPAAKAASSALPASPPPASSSPPKSRLSPMAQALLEAQQAEERAAKKKAAKSVPPPPSKPTAGAGAKMRG